MKMKTTYAFDDDSFWRKVRRFAGRLSFVRDAVAMCFAMRDPRTPPLAKATIAAALAYFVVPTDALPDLAPLGFTDDAAVVATALATVRAHVTRAHYRRADEWLS
jgi:uncharacterized membrane protein YkvA (DUF1232 family)